MKKKNSRDKFVYLAEKRVARAIKDLRLVGNLANKSNYSYTDIDVKKIISVLQKELRTLKKRFEAKGSPEEIIFKL